MTTNQAPDKPPMPWVNVSQSLTNEGVLCELIHLADVVRWMMKDKRLLFSPAVKDILKALEGFVGLELYVADREGGAGLVMKGDTFGLDRPIEPLRQRRTISRGIDYPSASHLPPSPPKPRPLPDGVAPGISAALFVMQYECGSGYAPEIILDGKTLTASLAMPCEQAALLWAPKGLAVVADNSAPLTFEEVAKQRQLHPKSDWTDPQKDSLVIEDDKQREKKSKWTRQAMADACGVKVQQIGQISRDHRAKKPQLSRVHYA